ncbi:M20 family metallopeptidase [Alkalihalobacillus oceani]|uniref:M20 family metallopeptidase n=1 Tax=Halalkalibacter oceani TaxID=1653776 RepID=UPI0020419E0F|nr:M20 family metallopeptidase [Halalkalibacter oceani]MCM3760436.1 M20 family metallopeptidase [Halalkalibacter oceani]
MTTTWNMNDYIKIEEVLQIIRDLIRIPSHWADQKREIPIANHLKELFESEGIDVYLQEVVDGRANVIATLKGTGEGPSLMFNGHIDTVPPFGMENPFDAKLKGNKLYGRGSADMKSGIGTMAYALIVLKRLGVSLKGDAIFTGVIDEDAAGSAGARYIAKNGPITDYAIVTEPTKCLPVTAHKGMDDFEIIFKGKSVHSSVPGNGINAIYPAADFIGQIEHKLIPQYNEITHPLVGSPTINVGLIQGSAKANKPFLLGQTETFSGIVPDICNVYLDVRWTPNQTIEQVKQDIEMLAREVSLRHDGVDVQVNYIPRPRPAMEINKEDRLVLAVQENVQKITGKRPEVSGETFWADSGILNGIAGIPTLMFGPGDIGVAHSDNEFIEIDDLTLATEVYIRTALEICGVVK